uniref:Major surface protein 1b n=1 Tax=Anaplasma marginale TaxID=770 RepID=Q9RQF2_ANAMA|nr:major surface protein 1b [Anaplasma marginale str. South Idaho]
MTEDDKQQQQNQSNVVQAISAVFQRKSAELQRLNDFIKGADGTLKNVHPHMKSLEALSKQLSEKIAAEAAAKADAKYESVGLRAKAAAALGNLGRLVARGKLTSSDAPKDLGQSIDNIPLMDEAPDTGERVVVQYGEEREFGKAAAWGLAGFKRTVDESLEMLGRGMHMLAEGQARISEGINAKDTAIVREGLETSRLGAGLCHNGLVEASYGVSYANKTMGKYAGKGLEKCKNKLGDACYKWSKALEEIESLRTAIDAKAEQQVEGEAWSPEGVSANTFYRGLHKIGAAIAVAAQATWEGLAMTGKFMGAVAKLAGAVSMCVAAYTAAIVGMAAATPATLLLTAMDNQSVNNAVVKVSEYLHSNVEQATKDLMASEFAMMTFGGIMTCAKLMKDSFAAINQKFEEVNATLAREATDIAQGIKEAYKSIGDAFGDAFKSVNTGIAKWTAALAGYASVEQLEEAKEADRVQADQRAEEQAMTERVAGERAATVAAGTATIKTIVSEMRNELAKGHEQLQLVITDMCNELAQIGAFSQAERDALVKSFTPKPPARTTKELISHMHSGLESVMFRMARSLGIMSKAGIEANSQDNSVEVAEISPETQNMSDAIPVEEAQIVETALLEAVNDSSKDDQAIVTDLINATIEVCTEQTNTLAGHTAEVQAGLEAAGIKLDDAQGLQEATPEAKGVEGINPEELEQAAGGLATAVNEASADGKIQSLNQQESQIAQGEQQQQQQSSGWSR